MQPQIDQMETFKKMSALLERVSDRNEEFSEIYSFVESASEKEILDFYSDTIKLIIKPSAQHLFKKVFDVTFKELMLMSEGYQKALMVQEENILKDTL